ncbi:hypothetical protein [Micromonospora sp. NPDC005161]
MGGMFVAAIFRVLPIRALVLGRVIFMARLRTAAVSAIAAVRLLPIAVAQARFGGVKRVAHGVRGVDVDTAPRSGKLAPQSVRHLGQLRAWCAADGQDIGVRWGLG